MSASIMQNGKVYWRLDGEADDTAPRQPQPTREEIRAKGEEMVERYRDTVMVLARAAAELTRQRDALGLHWLEIQTRNVFQIACDEFEKNA